MQRVVSNVKRSCVEEKPTAPAFKEKGTNGENVLGHCNSQLSALSPASGMAIGGIVLKREKGLMPL